MPRYRLTTCPPVEFDDLKTGQVALVLCPGANPRVRLIDTHKPGREWIAVSGMVFPRGALLIHITNQREDTDPPRVEVFGCDHAAARPMGFTLTVSQLSEMIADGVVEMDSSSGDDDNLYYRYDHYLVI